MEEQWIACALSVWRNIFLARSARKTSPSRSGASFSRVSSLDRRRERHRIQRIPDDTLTGITKVAIHRFEETINGRDYHIEVSPSPSTNGAQDRAAVRGPTALMPFYGTTPDEAATG